MLFSPFFFSCEAKLMVFIENEIIEINHAITEMKYAMIKKKHIVQE